MVKIYDNKYESIKQFLFSLFSVDEIYKHKDKVMENVQILIDEQTLKREISKQWIYLLGNSVNFNDLVDEFFKNRYKKWKKNLKTFQNIKTESVMKKFIEKNFPLSMLIRYEAETLSNGEILRFLELKEPNIKDFYHGRYGSYLNFLIYEDNFLHINLHLTLKEYITGTYGLLILFSLWFNETEFFDTLDLNIINKNYSTSILCYKILNKVLSLGFRKLNLFDKNEYWKQKYYPNINNEWAKSLPHLFIATGKEIINENPVFLFEELALKLNQIQFVIDDHEKSPILNPNDWYNNLSLEVQTFMEKGKELFLKIDEKYQEIRERKMVKKRKTKKPKENELTIEDVVLLFRDILEKDKQDNTILEENKGFRTINSFFKECENNLKKKSLQTLYNYFKQWANLDYYLESREGRHQGGGKEYRYKEGLSSKKYDPNKRLIEVSGEQKEIFQKEKIQVQQALNFYNNQKYKKARNLLIKISKNPSNDLIGNEQLYYGIIYYIGRCYQQLEDYHNAVYYFKNIYTEDKDFINVNLHFIESNLEVGFYIENFQIIDNTIKKLKAFLKIFDLPDYYKIYDDLEFTIRSISTSYNSLDDSLRPYLEYLENNDFKQFFIGINKTKLDLRILQKSFGEKDNTIIYYNFILTEKFYSTLLKLWFLKAECFRRYLNESIIYKKIDKFSETFNEILSFFNEIQQLNAKSKYPFVSILSYVHYFIGIAKLFDLTEIQSKLEENFPDGQKLHISPEFSYLKKYNEVYWFLNAVNQSIHDPKGVFRYEVKRLMGFDLTERKKPQESISLAPSIEAEFLFIKILLLEKYVLKDLIIEEEAFVEEIKNIETNDIQEIFKNWDDFHFPLYPHRNLISYTNLLSEFEEICKKNKLDMYREWIKKLYNKISNHLTKVKELRETGRTYALNRIFKILYSEFSIKIREFEISMEHISEHTSIEYYVYDLLRSEIKSAMQMHDKVGKFKVKLKFRNKKLMEYIMSFIKEHSFSIGADLDLNFSLWLEPEYQFGDNSDYIEIYHKISLTYEKVRFEEHLDAIPLAIFQVIKLNADELLIQVSDKFYNKFKAYFHNQFPKEYKNNYFEFIILEESAKNRFRIKISKLVKF